MLDLKSEKSSGIIRPDLHWYLRSVEEVIIRTLATYGIKGNRDEINTGVWVGKNKIAAVGVSSTRWITTHGFAINVDPDLGCFHREHIHPCGIEDLDRGVTSIGEILREGIDDDPKIPTIAEVASIVIGEMEKVFGVRIE
mgnify:CR=1 FL=1